MQLNTKQAVLKWVYAERDNMVDDRAARYIAESVRLRKAFEREIAAPDWQGDSEEEHRLINRLCDARDAKA